MMEKKRVYKGRTVHEYEVKGLHGDSNDFDVIQFCDAGNFGGRVIRTSATTAKVYVYVD